VQQVRQRYFATLDDRSDRRSIPGLSGNLLCVPYQTLKVLDIACTQGTALQLAGRASEPSVSLSDPLGMGVNVFHGTEAGDVGAGVTVRHHEPFV